MKILVIGGSYFFGRVFVMQAAKEHDITVVNRGTYSLAGLGVAEKKSDRRDEAFWKSCRDDYETIVDFCAYEKGDIAKVLRNLEGSVRQYVLISTVDVYKRGIPGRKREDTPFETRSLPGEAGAYIEGKVALEQELLEECGRKGIETTVLRPAVLYGPYNYAPRESAYIQLMVQNHVLPRVTDASGSFQFVYVKDAAEAVLKCLLNPKSYGQAYNVCPEETITYDLFLDALGKAADVEFTEIPMTAGQALQQGVPLPFPVAEEESELYSGEKGQKELGFSYISLEEGMARTYRAFKGVYGG